MRLRIDPSAVEDEDELRLVMIAETAHDRRTLRTVARVLELAARIDAGRTVDHIELPPRQR